MKSLCIISISRKCHWIQTISGEVRTAIRHRRYQKYQFQGDFLGKKLRLPNKNQNNQWEVTGNIKIFREAN